MFASRTRLVAKTEQWHKAGWISDDGLAAITADINTAQPRFGLASVLAILGAVLIGFAAMTFVAANWQALSKLVRIMIIISGMWVSYGLAALFFWRGQRVFANSALLAGIAVFGAGIMLIAQAYHMDGNPPDAVFVWALGALGTGILLRSNPAVAAALVLATFWSLWQTVISVEFHWPYLLFWALIAGTFNWLQWRPGFHLVLSAIVIWILFLRFPFSELATYGVVIPLGIGGGIGAAIFGRAIDRIAPIAKALISYSMVLGFTGLMTLQFLDRIPNSVLLVFAVLTLALLILAIFWGWLSNNRAVLWLGYVGFSTEILSLYFKTLGTLLGTSVFFLIAGLLVIGLSWVALQLHHYQTSSDGEPSR